jgi:hypothetical protein
MTWPWNRVGEALKSSATTMDLGRMRLATKRLIHDRSTHLCHMCDCKTDDPIMKPWEDFPCGVRSGGYVCVQCYGVHLDDCIYCVITLTRRMFG